MVYCIGALNPNMEFIKIAATVSVGIFVTGLCLAVTTAYFSPLGMLLFWSIFLGIVVAAACTHN
jgi:hypothetical protein